MEGEVPGEAVRTAGRGLDHERKGQEQDSGVPCFGNGENVRRGLRGSGSFLAAAGPICVSLQMNHSLIASSKSLAMGEEKEERNQRLLRATLFHNHHLI